MTENASAAPAAPAVTDAPAAPAPEAQPQTPAQPKPIPVRQGAPKPDSASFKEFEAHVRGKTPRTPSSTTDPGATDTEVNAAGRVVDAKTKQFVPSDKPAESEAATAATEPGAQAGPETTQEPKAPEIVEIPLPEGHPLRQRGQTVLKGPKEYEQDLRYAANTVVRNADVEQLRNRVAELEAEKASLGAAAEFWQTDGTAVLGPEFQRTYQELLELGRTEEAEMFKDGALARANKRLAERQAEARAEHEKGVLQTQARTFANEAYRMATGRYKGWNQGQIEDAIASFAGFLEATGQPMDLQAFQKHADALYLNDPEIQKVAQRLRGERLKAQVDEQAKREAAELDKKRQEEYVAGQRKNPLGSTPPVQNGLRVPTDGDRPKTFQEWEKGIRRRAMGRT